LRPVSHFLSDLSWDQYKERIEGGSIVLVPVGALEQHGHHMALGTDTIEVNEVCRRVSEQLDVVITPSIPFGYKSQTRSSAGNHWPGNIALDGSTLVALVKDVLVALRNHGAERIAVIDSHYENGWFLIEACDLATRSTPQAQGTIVSMLCWNAISKEGWERIYEDSGPMDLSLAHAGVLETSAMLEIAPDLVDMARQPQHDFVEFPPYDVFPPNPNAVPPTGVLSSAENSSSELGAVIMGDMSENLAQQLAAAFGLKASQASKSA
jgi:creatinine amidohydrolase